MKGGREGTGSCSTPHRRVSVRRMPADERVAILAFLCLPVDTASTKDRPSAPSPRASRIHESEQAGGASSVFSFQVSSSPRHHPPHPVRPSIHSPPSTTSAAPTTCSVHISGAFRRFGRICVSASISAASGIHRLQSCWCWW